MVLKQRFLVGEANYYVLLSTSFAMGTRARRDLTLFDIEGKMVRLLTLEDCKTGRNSCLSSSKL